MNICLIDKADLKDFPPVLSDLLALAELKYSVTFLTSGILPETRQLLENSGIKCVTLSGYEQSKTVFGKIFDYTTFRNRVAKYLKENCSVSDTLLWIAGSHI